MKTKVSEIAVLNAGPKKYKGVFPKIQYLDTSSVDQGKILEFQLFDVERDVIPSRAQRAVKDGTIVISSVRPNLKHYAFLKNPTENVVVSSGFVTVDALPERVDSKFLYYALTSAQATKYLDSIASTAVSSYPSFNPEDLGNYVIEIPDSLDKQREIARVLSSVDEKIENNNAICSNLEAMAKLLYDYWFVQFDFPDENGKPYKSSGGKMVWNEELKREIPEGWGVALFDDCISSINTGLNPRDNFKLNTGGQIRYLTVKNLTTAGTIDFTSCDMIDEEARAIVHKRSDIRVGDILFASIAPLGRCCIIMQQPEDWDINESVFSIRPRSEKMTTNFLYMTFMSNAFIKAAENSSAGSVFKGIRITELQELKTVLPPKQILDQFDKHINDLFSMKCAATDENQQLASLRDFLLPMLMNGQVKVG